MEEKIENFIQKYIPLHNRQQAIEDFFEILTEQIQDLRNNILNK